MRHGNLKNLSNTKLIALGINIQKVIAKAPLTSKEKEALEIFNSQFDKMFETFVKAGDLNNQNFSSEKKQEMQNFRKQYFIGLKFLIKAYLHSEFIDQKIIAEKIKKAITKHGWDLSSYNPSEQSVKFSAIIEELNLKVSNEEIESINATQWIDGLKQAQLDFISFSADLSIINSKKIDPPSAHRTKFFKILTKYINFIPLQNEMTPSTNLDNLIVSIDKVIEEAIAPIKAQQSRKLAKEKKEIP